MVRMNKTVLWINLFGDVRPQFVLSHQDGVLVGHDGVLVGHKSFQEKKHICSPVLVNGSSQGLSEVCASVICTVVGD